MVCTGPGQKCSSEWSDHLRKGTEYCRRTFLDFKASNGWLDSFKDRYGIGFYRVSGESADVDSEIADKFKERLPEITAKYDKKDISIVMKQDYFSEHYRIRL